MQIEYLVFVAYPRIADELRDAVKPFELACFPSICAFPDGVHVQLCVQVQVRWRQEVSYRLLGTLAWTATVSPPSYLSLPRVARTTRCLPRGTTSSSVQKDPVYILFECKISSRRGVQTTRGVTICVVDGYQNHREFLVPFEWPAIGTWQGTWSKGWSLCARRNNLHHCIGSHYS